MGVDDEECCDTELGLGMRIRHTIPLQMDVLPLAPPQFYQPPVIARKNFMAGNGLDSGASYSKQHGDTHNDNMKMVSLNKNTMSYFHVDSNIINREGSHIRIGFKREREIVTEDFEGDKEGSHIRIGFKREREIVTEDFEGDKSCCRVSDEDEEGCGTRKKLRLSKEQSATLEETFKVNSTLNTKQKQTLAKHLNLSPRQVEVWFQNRRARTKFKQTEVDCEFLRRCYESLAEENRRLREELIELRSLKLAATSSPLYMQRQSPSATLTVCPSCQRVEKTDKATPFTSLQKSHFYPSYSHSSSVAC